MPPNHASLSLKDLWIYTVAVMALLVWSGIAPYERGTWLMEVAPVLIALPLLLATHRRFPLTPLLYGLIALHMAVLILGGHYTYARVPLGHWMQQWFGFERNHYDRIGHLMQGFVPAIAARELLLRLTPLARPEMRGGWLFTLVTAVCLAISALYELIEWGAAEALGGGRRRVPRHPGRPVRHPEGHVLRVARRDGRPVAAGALARPAVAGTHGVGSGESLVAALQPPSLREAFPARKRRPATRMNPFLWTPIHQE